MKNQFKPGLNYLSINLNWGLLKFQLGNKFEENVKITQMQARFVLEFTVHFKFDMTWTWTGDFLNSSLENNSEQRSK